MVIAKAHRQIAEPGGSKTPMILQGIRQFAFINPIRRHFHRFRLTTRQLRLTCDAGPAPRMTASGQPG